MKTSRHFMTYGAPDAFVRRNGCKTDNLEARPSLCKVCHPEPLLAKDLREMVTYPCIVAASSPESSLRSQLSEIKSDTFSGGPSPKAAQDDRLWFLRESCRLILCALFTTTLCAAQASLKIDPQTEVPQIKNAKLETVPATGPLAQQIDAFA